MESLFTKEYRINEMGYVSVGTVGRFEWLIKKLDDRYLICAINQYGKVEFGTEKTIDNKYLEVIRIFESK